jgi:hypothetical protein
VQTFAQSFSKLIISISQRNSIENQKIKSKFSDISLLKSIGLLFFSCITDYKAFIIKSGMCNPFRKCWSMQK